MTTMFFSWQFSEFWGKSLQKLYIDLNSYYCTIIHKSVFVHLLFDISVVFFNKQNSPPPFSLQNAFFPKKCQVSQTINSTTRKSVGDNQQVYVPVDLQKAWASLHGLPVDPTALEGITQLQGWIWGV